MTTINAVGNGLSGSTGTGNFVGATSPTLVTPALGTPSSGTLTSCTGLPISTGVSGLGSNVATWLATPTSANLATAVATTSTGSGSLVFATSPTFVTPVLGTPSSGTLTSCTGLPISTGVTGLGSNVATWLATPTSANLATAVATTSTGSGSLVFNTSPTFVTPALGTPASGNLSNCTNIPGAITVVDQNSASVTMAANVRYIIDNGASLVTLTLPSSPTLGDTYYIVGSSSGGWKMGQAASQVTHVGGSATTSGTGGSLASTNQYDCLTITATTSNVFVAHDIQSTGLTIV